MNQTGVEEQLRMWRTLTFYVVTMVSVEKPQLDQAKAFIWLRVLEARSIQSRV